MIIPGFIFISTVIATDKRLSPEKIIVLTRHLVQFSFDNIWFCISVLSLQIHYCIFEDAIHLYVYIAILYVLAQFLVYSGVQLMIHDNFDDVKHNYYSGPVRIIKKPRSIISGLGSLLLWIVEGKRRIIWLNSFVVLGDRTKNNNSAQDKKEFSNIETSQVTLHWAYPFIRGIRKWISILCFRLFSATCTVSSNCFEMFLPNAVDYTIY